MPTRNRLRACVVCRVTFTATRADQWRCDHHQAAHDWAKDAHDRQRRPYDHAERVEHGAILTAWVQVHGWLCPGLDDHPAHNVEPGGLSVHHQSAVGDGGSRAGGPKMVLCLTANQRLGGRLGGTRSRPA
jgi:hypothetical protein